MNENQNFENNKSEIIKEIDIKKCILCLKLNATTININSKRDLIATLNKLGIQIESVDGETDWICYQCIYKLYTIKDLVIQWGSNFNRSRINYYRKAGDKEMVRRLLNINNNNVKGLPVPSSTPPTEPVRNDINRKITNANRTAATMAMNMQPLQNGLSENSSYQHGNLGEYVLPVIFERSERAIITESGGSINGFISKSVITSGVLKCKYCPRTYKKANFLKKHEKNHAREVSKASSRRTEHTNKTIHSEKKCLQCDTLFTSALELKKHLDTHKTKHKCKYCPSEFILKKDYEFHELACFENFCYLQNIDLPNRYITRSSRVLLRQYCLNHLGNNNHNGDDEEDDAVSIPDSTYHERLTNTTNWVKRIISSPTPATPNNDEMNNALEDDVQSLITTFTRNTSVAESVALDGGTDTIEFNISQSDTTATTTKKRRRRSKKIEGDVDNVTINLRRTPRRSCKDNLTVYQSQVRSLEQSRLYNCPEESCTYKVNNLKDLYVHDLAVHDIKFLYTCKRCNGSYLRRCYYDDHLRQQNPGRFVCIKCEQIFMFEYELKAHFNDHRNNSNKDSLKCDYCNLSFLCEEDLEQHKISPQHFLKKSKPKSIFRIKNSYAILGSQPIVNEITQQSPQPYASEIRIRQFLEISKRDRELLPPKRFPGRPIINPVNGFTYPNCTASEYKNIYW